MKKLITIIILCLFAVIVIIVNHKYYLIKKEELLKGLTQKVPNLSGLLIEGEDGNPFLLDAKDHLFTGKFLKHGCWEPHLTNLIKQIVKPGNKVIVVGGHVGTHTVLFSKLVGTQGHIDVFEPNPQTLKFLKTNIWLNPIKNITLHEKAAFSENTQLKFIKVARNNNPGSSHLVRDSKNYIGEEITVEAVTLDSVLSAPEEGFDIMQVDAEGAEIKVILGAQNIIDKSPNLIILQEWSPFWMKTSDINQYLKFWRDRNYKIARINGGKLIELSDDELQKQEQIDIIITKNLEETIKNFKPFRKH